MDKGQTIMEVSPSCDTPEAEASAGYKRTEAGVIPQDWTFGRLADLGVFRSGSGFPLMYQGLRSGDYPFFKVSDMNNQGNELFMKAANHRISEETRKKLSAIRHPIGSIVFAKIGAAIFLERKRLLSQESCIDNNMMAFRLMDHRACPKFFYYLFLCLELGKLVSTTALPSLSGRQIGAISVPIPPFEEQRAIAEALSDVDGLLASLDALIYKNRAIKQAAMQQLLTGKTRLPGFSGAWETRRLEQVTDCFDHVRIPLNEIQRVNRTGPYPYCGANGVLDHVDDFVIDSDVILIAEDGGYFDEYAYRPIAYRMSGKIWVNNHAHILKAKFGYSQGFLFYSMVHKNILPYLASGTRAKLNKSEMNRIEIYIPLDSDEQEAIAVILSDMDAEISALEKRRNKTRVLKQGMMQSLLTGRTRLLTPE